MKFNEAFTKVRRRMGILFLTKSDIEWRCQKVVKDNQEVFDRLK